MTEGLLLLARASSGTATQWDGTATPKGVLLRWLIDGGLGFPDLGFDLLRAPLDKSRTVVVPGQLVVGDPLVSDDGRTTFMLVRGRVTVAPDGTIELEPGTRLDLLLRSPVAVVDVDVVAREGPTVSVFAGGALVGTTRTWADTPPWQWVARAIDQVVLEGPGSVESLRIRRVEDAAPWTPLAHLCLPLDDPRYGCAPREASAEEVARSRLPDGDVWGRYEPGFGDLLRTLQTVVFGDPPPAAPAPAAGDPNLALGSWDALQLAALDIDLARILGLAYDDEVPIDDSVLAYRVVGHWAGGDRADTLALTTTDRGPPAGPDGLTALVDQPAGPGAPFRVRLRWEASFSDAGAVPETGIPLYQLLAADVEGSLTGPAPAAPDPSTADPVTAAPLLVTRRMLLARPPVAFYVDDPSHEGWRYYWARSVDLFGCVSLPSGATLLRLEDVAAPPPPPMLLAEYVQHDIPDAPGAQSPMSRLWRASHPDEDAVVVAWGWPPELAVNCPDADSFAVFVRPPPTGTSDPDRAPWPDPLLETRPAALALTSVVAVGDTSMTTVRVSAVTAIDATHSALETDMELHVSGELVGATVGSARVVRSGVGFRARLVIEHGDVRIAAGVQPLNLGASGLYVLRSGLDLGALDALGWQRRIAGVVVPASAQRAAVVGRSDDGLLCRSPS